MTGSIAVFGAGYASIGFAADYRDKCQITVSFPNAESFYQFLEANSGSPMGAFSHSGGQGGDAPDSAKDWNATINTDGTLGTRRDERVTAART